MVFRPYLFFGGNCRQAFTHYQEIFGGELTLVSMKDVPGEEPQSWTSVARRRRACRPANIDA